MKYPSVLFGDLLGNVFADLLADLGESLAEVPANQAAGYMADLKLVRCIPQRAVVALRKAPKRQKALKREESLRHSRFTAQGQDLAMRPPRPKALAAYNVARLLCKGCRVCLPQVWRFPPGIAKG